MKKIELLEHQFCLHRNPTLMGGLFGCSDCGLNGKIAEMPERLKLKLFPLRKDPVIDKVNEIIVALNKLSSPATS